ncbi:MAG: C-GCAxxG-C-C family protein [Tepidisphaeraceae bacterium]|jgi:C_GCAxxG_C_C family probable redox protein
MSDNPQAAATMFLEGYNCAQSVFACCGRSFGLPRETAIKVAQAFGGGMGRTGNVCGAVTGALMVIGLKHSTKDAKDTAAKDQAYALAEAFLSRFRAQHGSVTCRDLLGCDLSTPEGRRRASESGLFKTLCPRLVEDAAQIVEQLLAADK